MRKNILSIALVTLGFVAMSCKKITCTCTDNNTGVISSSTVSAATVAAADVKCNEKTTSQQTCEW